MSLRKTIEKAADQAFSAAGDLVEDVTLHMKSDVSYNFSTGETSNSSSYVSIKAIVMSEEQESGVREILSPRKEIYVKEKELQDPALYETITINNVKHTIISFTHQTGIVILLATEG